MDVTSYLLGKKAGGGETPTYQDKEITITENGEQTITADTGYNALSSVGLTVNVPSGADLSEYFNSSIGTGSQTQPGWLNVIKKIPNITVSGSSLNYSFLNYNVNAPIPTITNINDVSNFNYAFSGVKYEGKLDLSYFISKTDTTNYLFSSTFASSNFTEIDLSGIGTLNNGNVSFINTFSGCKKLKKVNLSNLNFPSNVNHNTNYMFYGCSDLEEIDLSSLDFSTIWDKSDMFTQVPANCLIYVKNQAQVDWFTTNFPSLTNVQIKGA